MLEVLGSRCRTGRLGAGDIVLAHSEPTGKAKKKKKKDTHKHKKLHFGVRAGVCVLASVPPARPRFLGVELTHETKWG